MLALVLVLAQVLALVLALALVLVLVRPQQVQPPPLLVQQGQTAQWRHLHCGPCIWRERPKQRSLCAEAAAQAACPALRACALRASSCRPMGHRTKVGAGLPEQA